MSVRLWKEEGGMQGTGEGEGRGKGSKGTDRDRAMDATPDACNTYSYFYAMFCEGPSDPVACSSLIKVPHNSTTHKTVQVTP